MENRLDQPVDGCYRPRGPRWKPSSIFGSRCNDAFRASRWLEQRKIKSLLAAPHTHTGLLNTLTGPTASSEVLPLRSPI